MTCRPAGTSECARRIASLAGREVTPTANDGCQSTHAAREIPDDHRVRPAPQAGPKIPGHAGIHESVPDTRGEVTPRHLIRRARFRTSLGSADQRIYLNLIHFSLQFTWSSWREAQRAERRAIAVVDGIRPLFIPSCPAVFTCPSPRDGAALAGWPLKARNGAVRALLDPALAPTPVGRCGDALPRRQPQRIDHSGHIVEVAPAEIGSTRMSLRRALGGRASGPTAPRFESGRSRRGYQRARITDHPEYGPKP